MLKERKNNKIIITKNYFKKERERKKNKPAGFKLAKPVLLVFLSAANSGGLAQLFSVADQHWAASGPALQAPGSTGSGTHLPWGCGCVCTGPSLIHTLPSACGLRSLPVAHSPVGVGGLNSLRDEVWTLPGQ